MKYLSAFFLLFTASIACAGLPGFLTQQTQDWRFIQSVGGIKISLVGSTLNIDCDVSGTREIIVKPTMINSAMGIRKVTHKQVGKTIQLSVVTSVIEKGMSGSPKTLDLSAHPDPGEYSVEYLNPDGTTQPLGKITLTAIKVEEK